MKIRLILFIKILLTFSIGFSQSTYFNKQYNPNHAACSARSVINTDSNFVFIIVGGDSISSYRNVNTFLNMNKNGNIKNFKESCFDKFLGKII